jgi:hypothetical protein
MGALGELSDGCELGVALEEVVCGALEQGGSIIGHREQLGKDWGVVWGRSPMRSRAGFSTLLGEGTFIETRGWRLACAAISVIAATAAVPSVATAAVSTTGFEVTSDMPLGPGVPNPGPSTVVAGAHPSAGSFSTFGYPDSTEDLKTAITNFGPGLLGNPESVPKCPEAALEAGGAACPPGSLIGSSRLDISTGASIGGQLYNAELLGNEPGRLAAVTNAGPPLGIIVSSLPMTITPRGGGDYGLTGTLTNVSRLLPGVQVTALGFIINASTNFVRNPTSCELNASTGQGAGYDDPAFVDGPPYQFTTTGCQQLPYDPKVAVTVGDRGSTAFNQFPPFVFKIAQAAGEADIMGNKVTLPIELNSNNTAYTLCSQAQADADNCPAASKFGWVTAHSPFLSEASQGPVYLFQQTATSLPGLLLDFRGRVHVKVQTKTSLVNRKQIQSLVLNAPQLPVSDITVALNGGRKTGVFLNREDLCFKGNSTTKFNSVTGLVKSYGWNGKQTPDQKYTATVNGCGPAVKASLRGATGSRPRLGVTVTKHPDAPNIKELEVTLSKNLTVSSSRLDSGGSASASAAGASLEFVSNNKFRVTGLPTAGAGKVTIRLRNGAVRVGKRSRSVLRRGKSKGFAVKVTQTPVSGKDTTTKAKFRVKCRGC